jgi:hypothetical protein
MIIWNLKFWLWRTEVAIEQPLNHDTCTRMNNTVMIADHFYQSGGRKRKFWNYMWYFCSNDKSCLCRLDCTIAAHLHTWPNLGTSTVWSSFSIHVPNYVLLSIPSSRMYCTTYLVTPAKVHKTRCIQTYTISRLSIDKGYHSMSCFCTSHAIYMSTHFVTWTVECR